MHSHEVLLQEPATQDMTLLLKTARSCNFVMILVTPSFLTLSCDRYTSQL